MAMVKGNDLILAMRMVELCRPPSAWNRSLWSVSTQTAIHEVLEASRFRRDGILSDASLINLQHTTSISIGKDAGAGNDKARKILQGALGGKTVITPGSLATATLEQGAADIEANYLNRWADFVGQSVSESDVEKCARSVVSHLLNRGHSRAFLSERIRIAVLAASSTITTAGDMIRDLQTFDVQPCVNHQAVFPVVSAPDSGKTKSQGWMRGVDLVRWMKINSIPTFQENERVCGAVTLTVAARDRAAAKDAAAAEFVAIRDRALLGARKPIVSLGFFWIAGSPERMPIEQPNRGVEVASIRRQDHIYSNDNKNLGVSRAIALLAELDHGPSSAAVTSGWAALESLAMGPAEDGDRIETAVRIATLATASFVRAELATLAYAYADSNKGAPAGGIRNSASNRERCERFLQMLDGGQPIPRFVRIEDTAGAMRMKQLLSDPVKALHRVNHHIECALRRLYRLRNLVAHGARTDSVVLEAGASAAAPLVGAAFDRIHHAGTSQNLSPVELIARARTRIAMLDAKTTSELISLLD